MKLKWKSASKENPGYSVWHASPERDENVTYAIRQKRKTRDFTPTGWNVFVRSSSTEPFRTIFRAETLAEGKEFVQDWEDLRARAAETTDVD